MSYSFQEKLKIILISIFIGNIFVFGRIFCVTIGSNTVVSRFAQQQILNNGDIIAGFAAIEGGFKLNTNFVLATFDSNFPVTGAVELEGGTLSLSKDLIFNDISSFKTLGNITGNSHKMELAQSIKVVPEGNLESLCGSEVCSISHIAESVQSNIIYSCDWSFDDKFIALGILSNGLRIYQFDGVNLTLKYSDVINSKTVNDLSWHPSKNLLAVGTIVNTLSTELQIYSVDQAGTATLVSGVETNCIIYAVDWHPSGNFIAVGQNSSTKEVAIYAVDSNGRINSTPVSIYDTPYAVQLGAVRWNKDGTYLAVGISASATEELLIFKFNKQTGVLTLDFPFSVGSSVYSVAWSKVSPNFLAVGLYRTTGEMLQIYELDPALSTLTERAAKSDLSTYLFSVDWSPKSNCLAVGINYSVGYEFRTFYFDAINYSLDQTAGFELGSYAVRCARWARSGNYVAQGCSNKYLYVYEAQSCNSAAMNVEFDDLKVFLNGDVLLKNSGITFKGDSLIDGRGHCLDLSETSSIIIERNSSLLLNNLSIVGLSTNNICCTDGTSTLLMNNCTWKLGSDYNFNSGHFELLGNFNIIGDGYNFTYGSGQESIVGPNASLILDRNLVFNCDPSLIILQDKTSKILVSSSSDISSLFSLVNANTANIDGNSSSIDNLKTSTGNLLALVNANIASIIANNSSIAANNLSIAGNSFAIDSLKTSTGNLLALVNSNTASIIANNSSIAGNSSAIDSLKTSTGELELYIDNIIDFGLEEIRDELDELGTITTALRVSIDDLYLRAGACVHNIYQDTNFTRDMLPKAGKVALFRFNECCLPTDKPRLIFDPSVYGESNEIELLDNARIIFEGEGIVELRDGVKFKLNGVAQELNNDLEFSSCAKIIVRNGAVLSVAANSIAQCVGVGQICVCGHGGSLVLDNENSQFIFGQSLNDLLKLLVEDCGLVSIDSQSSILTFQYGKFAVDFRRSSILNIYRGLVEFNSNKAVQATGKLVLLRFISGSSLMIDKCISGGQEIYAGTLRMCPNIGCETVKFDNRTGVIYGDGHLQFISFNKNLVTDLIVQHNSFKDINTMSKIFMQLGAVGQSSSSGSSGAANSISSPSAASPISFGVTTDGQIASFNSEVDSSAVKLKDGDHDISYVNSGNIFVVGIDKNGKVFKIDKDGNRTMIGKV